MSGEEYNSVFFGKNWARFARRQTDKRRLAFFDTFLKMVDGWKPGEDATNQELDDYDFMEPLFRHGEKRGGRPKKETPLETPLETLKKKNGIENDRSVKRESPSRTREASAAWTIEQFVSAGMTAGVPADFCREVWNDINARGWTDERGRRTLTSPRNYLKTAWNGHQKKIAARAAVESSGRVERDPATVIDLEG